MLHVARCTRLVPNCKATRFHRREDRRRMIRGGSIVFGLAAIAGLVFPATAQSNRTAKNTSAVQEHPLVLTETIPLENAKGRFDHFAMGGGRPFVAALGSNAVEVINLGGRILERTLA